MRGEKEDDVVFFFYRVMRGGRGIKEDKENEGWVTCFLVSRVVNRVWDGCEGV